MMNLRTTLRFFALTLVSWTMFADTEVPRQGKVATMSTADFGSYTYDGSGNITGIGADRFTYDEYGRIKSVRLTQGATTVAQSFTYDRYGNILSIATSGGDTIVPAVDPLTNRINKPTTSTNALGAYDGNGNMTSYNTISSFSYDPLDVMSESTVNGERRVYLYTAGNERVATLKIGGASNAVTGSSWTLRDASAKVLRRLSKDAAGVWRWDEDYVYNGSQMLASEVPGNTLQFHLDHLGTPRVITGNGGVRLAAHTYFPFGREMPASTPDAETKKFTGHERDDINLDYMHARYYMPYPGRFLSVDPTWNSADISKPLTWNRYSYALNNPVRYTDPDGRCATVIDAINCMFGLKAIADAVVEGFVQTAANSGMGKIYRGAATRDARLASEGQAQLDHEILTGMMFMPMMPSEGSGTVNTTTRGEAWVNPETFGTIVGSGVRAQATGKMATIANEVTSAEMSQANAAVAVDSAVKATGLRTTGVVGVGKDLVVGSVAPGTNKPVMVVNSAGVVRPATATIEVTKDGVVISHVQ